MRFFRNLIFADIALLNSSHTLVKKSLLFIFYDVGKHSPRKLHETLDFRSFTFSYLRKL